MKTQSTLEEANRIFDEDLVNRFRDRLLNQQYWGDEEAWLHNAAWLALPDYCQATLEPVLNEIGIDVIPFARFNAWLTQQEIRNPRDMSRRLDDGDHNDLAASGYDDAEVNSRIEGLMGNSGLLAELRGAVEI